MILKWSGIAFAAQITMGYGRVVIHSEKCIEAFRFCTVIVKFDYLTAGVIDGFISE